VLEFAATSGAPRDVGKGVSNALFVVGPGEHFSEASGPACGNGSGIRWAWNSFPKVESDSVSPPSAVLHDPRDALKLPDISIRRRDGDLELV